MRKERMLIPLSQLKPNPERDFKVDPLDQAAVEALVTSITEDGFWGGVTARPSANGGYEIAAGHHRVEAARRAGLSEAEIFVGDFDDQTMVRIYARENATQRSKQVTALDGSVLAATRLLARQLLGGTYREITTSAVFESKKSFDSAKGRLTEGDGIGQPLISKVLKDMPGMTENSIRESLSRLKSSGDYARTLTAVIQQIEAEAEAARQEAERLERERREAETRAEAERRKAEELKRQQQAAREKAEAERLERERQEQERRQAEEQVKAEQLKAQQEAAEQAKEQKAAAAKSSAEAAAKVAKRKVTFDLSGVAAYLPNTHQINTFRKLAEKNSQYLPVENQAALAQALKEEAARQKTELSASFIHDQFMRLLMDVKQTERTFASKAAKATFEAKSQQERDKAIQEDIAHNLRGALTGFVKLRESRKKSPAPFAFTYASVLRNAVVAVADEIVKFNEEFS